MTIPPRQMGFKVVDLLIARVDDQQWRRGFRRSKRGREIKVINFNQVPV